MRVKLVVAYDGTDYVGWQVQPNGVSVQETVNLALSRFFSQDIHTIGASRTDAGVHALGNVCAFDVDTMMPAEKIAYAINQTLPNDIVIQSSEEVADDFNPRYSALQKTYEYRILNRTFPIPTLSRYTHFYHYPLNTCAMNEAARELIGEHDFTSFASVHSQTNSYIRKIYDARVTRDDNDVVTFEVTGNGFLYNMVRIIAGTLIEVGSGMKEISDIARILSAKDRSLAGPTAPAKGLTLIKIQY